eukprot:761363-Hanusia_phi.AAC.3
MFPPAPSLPPSLPLSTLSLSLPLSASYDIIYQGWTPWTCSQTSKVQPHELRRALAERLSNSPVPYAMIAPSPSHPKSSMRLFFMHLLSGPQTLLVEEAFDVALFVALPVPDQGVTTELGVFSWVGNFGLVVVQLQRELASCSG